MQTRKTWRTYTLAFSRSFFLFSFSLSFLCLGALNSHASEVKADDILGYWLSEEKTAVIHIQKKQQKNDDKGSYYGEIVWLKNSEKLDAENPDESQRSRPILGIRNTWGFVFDGEGEWTDGNIYDPKNGKVYSANMELADGGEKLELRGYVGIPLFGRTTEWTREEGKVPAHIQNK